MEEAKSRWQQPRSWIGLIVIVILIIFLLFYKPFEQYLLDNIPRIHFSNILFWFAAVIGLPPGYLGSALLSVASGREGIQTRLASPLDTT